MSFKQITPYKLKHIIPIFGLIGCGLTTSCEKNEPLTVPQRGIQLILPGGTNSIYNDGNQEFMDMVYSYADYDYTDTVYIVASGNYNTLFSDDIHNLRTNVLEPAKNYSPKIYGNGNFNFRPGEASKVPSDSAWIVQNGWAINNQKQR